jgi:arylsulfatase
MKREVLNLLGILGVSVSTMAAERPNIVVVMTDDMGYSDIGCFGGEIETPVLDDLAKEGLRFTHFTNSAKCSTSRAALMSGLWPGQAGQKSLRHAVAFPKFLRQAGFRTGAVGKWDLDATPLDHGFETYFGHLNGATDFISGNQHFMLNDKPFNKFGETTEEFYATDAFTDYAIEFVNQWKNETPNEPFFLYVAYNAPHAPLQAPETLVKKYRGRYLDGWEAIRAARFERQKNMGMFPESAVLPDWEPNHRNWADLNDNERSWEDYRMAIYAAMVDSIDQNLGRLIDVLKANGEWENTLFLFTSDNGSNPFERSGGLNKVPWQSRSTMRVGTEWAAVNDTPYRFYKQFTTRGGCNGPLLVHWPSGLRARGWNHSPSHLVDVMPTALELAGFDYPETFDGKATEPPAGESLVPHFEERAMKRGKPIFYNYFHNAGLLAADGGFKLVSRRMGKWELYDLRKDPFETTNVATRYPKQCQLMITEWRHFAGHVTHANKQSMEPRENEPAPWGLSSSYKTEKNTGPGRLVKDEQRPKWPGTPPPVPLP